MLDLRDLPGLPDPSIQPPTVAHSGDPFSALRIVHLVARVPRGRPLRVRDLVDRLNADYLDWTFSRPVVIDAIVQLQSNWLSDYRTRDGILIEEGDAGPELTVEDSGRVNPWIIRQVERLAADCREALQVFARDQGNVP